jgi:hypothetical protein
MKKSKTTRAKQRSTKKRKSNKAESKNPKPNRVRAIDSLDGVPAESLLDKSEPPPFKEEGKRKKESDAQVLVRIARAQSELFMGADDNLIYATVRKGNGIADTYSVVGSEYRHWMDSRFEEESDKVPTDVAFRNATRRVCSGILDNDGPKKNVCLRSGSHQENVYLDIRDPQRRVIRVNAAGWQIVSEAPICFYRPSIAGALPIPVAGQRVELLREFLTMDDNAWRLYLPALLSYMLPSRRFVILGVTGEYGSAKSTLVNITKAFVDPGSQFEYESPLPKDEKDFVVRCVHERLITLGNLTHLPGDLSNLACQLVFGVHLPYRVLYTNDDVRKIFLRRPLILSGISDVATRGDLADRYVKIQLPVLTQQWDKAHKGREFEPCFAEKRSEIFGALLDLLVAVLLTKEGCISPEMVRVKEYGAIGVAVERVLGWPSGSFEESFKLMRQDTKESVLESNILVGPLLTILSGRGLFEGTSDELLGQMTALSPQNQYSRGWPKDGGWLMKRLGEIADDLRKIHGITIGQARRGTNDRRTYTIMRSGTAKQARTEPHGETTMDPRDLITM